MAFQVTLEINHAPELAPLCSNPVSTVHSLPTHLNRDHPRATLDGGCPKLNQCPLFMYLLLGGFFRCPFTKGHANASLLFRF